jgi:hypothetical protein
MGFMPDEELEVECVNAKVTLFGLHREGP